MALFSQLCEDIRNAVDDQGAKECYRKSVDAFARKSGLPIAGLWAVVDHVLNGDNPEKALKRLQKSWGGEPTMWAQWWKMAQSKPDC